MHKLSLNTFLNYNFDISAKQSGKALALVNHHGQIVLREVDLKTATIWKKICLWWNSSLNKKVITKFLDHNFQKWNALDLSHEERVKFEKQWTKLLNKNICKNSKIINQQFMWKLHLIINYPNSINQENELFEKKSDLF